MKLKSCGLAAALVLTAALVPVQKAEATIVAYHSFEDNAEKAAAVVKGTVTERESRIYEGPEGPAVATYYTFEIDHSWVSDKAGQETLTLVNPGGDATDGRLIQPIPPGFIDYPVGAELVLFLETDGKYYFPPALHLSTYRVDTDEETGAEKYVRVGGTAKVVGQDTTLKNPLFEKRAFSPEEFDTALTETLKDSGKAVTKISASGDNAEDEEASE